LNYATYHFGNVVNYNIGGNSGGAVGGEAKKMNQSFTGASTKQGSNYESVFPVTPRRRWWWRWKWPRKREWKEI